MNPERWRRIEQLYHAALDLQPEKRGPFLAKECQSDQELKREVESLIAHDRTGVIDRPAWEGATNQPDDATVTMLGPGSKLGPYQILDSVGAGGMGQVYRARDSRLGRSVAIKVSNAEFSARFEREGRAISALNHPHICTLYDVGPNYLVMELVEGETLGALLKKGACPMELTLRYGVEIADALAAAHALGITHRDLKPGNIMITRTGVKILDFGLAKLTRPVNEVDFDEELTGSHEILGTPAYMAPEQLSGKPCDARTDIFALGLVLYEMATGKRPQIGGQALIWDGLAARFAHIAGRCLEQDPENRWQSAKDVKAELEWAGKAPPAAEAGSRKGWPRWAWIAAAVVCAGVAVLAVSIVRREPAASERSARFILKFEEKSIANRQVFTVMPIPSPDGHYLAFLGGGEKADTAVWIRPLDATESKRLPGTDGAAAIMWSPDGRWVGFHADGKLKKVNLVGGPPQTIASIPAIQEAVWGSRGDIIYRPSNRFPLFRINESGGSPLALTQIDRSRSENSHRGLSFLPDGRRFLFTARCAERQNNALYIGSLDTGKIRRLMPVQSSVRYAPPTNSAAGALLYYRDGAMLSQPFDADSEKLTGEPVAVSDSVSYDAAGLTVGFRSSADGTVAVILPANANDTWLTWFDRDGSAAGAVGRPGLYFQPRLSPNGDRVAFSRPDLQTGNRDIWYFELARGVANRITLNGANDWFPVWSPDGRQMLFGSDRSGGTEMQPYLKKSIEAEGDEAPFLAGSEIQVIDPVDWSKDGKWITLGAGDILVAPVIGDRKPFRFLATQFREGGARFSPDSKWIAYVSNETGRDEVFVRPFAGGPAAAEGKIQVSTNGGDFPVWRQDGHELYFMAADASIYAANTTGLGRLASAPVPVRLFRACPDTLPLSPPGAGFTYGYAYDTLDGQRFLANCMAQPPGRFVVLMNWRTGK